MKKFYVLALLILSALFFTCAHPTDDTNPTHNDGGDTYIQFNP